MANSLFQQAKELWDGFTDTGAGTHAAGIAFFFFLSFIPLLIIYAWIVSMAGVNEQMVVGFFSSIIPPSFHGFVESVVHEAYAKSGIAFSVSLLTLLWSASRGIQTLRTGLNAMYGIKEKQNGLVVAIISIVSVIILIALLTMAMLLIFSGFIGQIAAGVMPGQTGRNLIQSLVDMVLMLGFGTLVFTVCYTFLGEGSRNFRNQIPGAALAAIAWSLLSLGFRIYVDNFSNYDLFYGSLATVALFMFWLYLAFYIVLAGAFVNHYRASETGSDKRA